MKIWGSFFAWCLLVVSLLYAISNRSQGSANTLASSSSPIVNAVSRLSARQVDPVFSDIDTYHDQLIRLSQLVEQMQAKRRIFSKHVSQLIQMLEGSRRPSCHQRNSVYETARQAGKDFVSLGRVYELIANSVISQHASGQSIGLSPRARLVAATTEKQWKTQLRDAQIVHAVWRYQLLPEIRSHKCKAASKVEDVPDTKKSMDSSPSSRSVKVVSVVVDNRQCDKPVEVYIDNRFVTSVDAAIRHRLRTVSGDHILCLLQKGSDKRCGDTGTNRAVYFYDGWSVTVHCFGS